MSQQILEEGDEEPDAHVVLQDAADQLGVHYMTAYRYVRSGQLHAAKHNGRWMVARRDLDEFARRDRSSPAGRRLPVEERRARLRARLLAGDGQGAWTIVEDALRASVEAGEILTDIILPIMHSLGEEWHRGEISVAQEHTATAVARRLVARLGPVESRRGRRRGAVVLGSVAGDQHDLGVAVLANLLRAEGYEARDLGGNVPLSAFVEAVDAVDRPVGVVIAWSAPDRDRAIRVTVEGLRETGTEVIVGGPATDAAVVTDAGGIAAESMGHAVDLLAALQ